MIRETSYTGARKNLAALMDQVTDTHEPVVIRRRGKEPVALIAAEDLSAWMVGWSYFVGQSEGKAKVDSDWV